MKEKRTRFDPRRTMQDVVDATQPHVDWSGGELKLCQHLSPSGMCQLYNASVRSGIGIKRLDQCELLNRAKDCSILKVNS